VTPYKSPKGNNVEKGGEEQGRKGQKNVEIPPHEVKESAESNRKQVKG